MLAILFRICYYIFRAYILFTFDGAFFFSVHRKIYAWNSNGEQLNTGRGFLRCNYVNADIFCVSCAADRIAERHLLKEGAL